MRARPAGPARFLVSRAAPWWHNQRMACRDVSLAFASISDAQALAVMTRDLIETGLGWSYRSGRIATLIADPETITLIARDGRERLGFAMMSFGQERAHLILLAVRPPHRRHGLARRMLTWLLDSAAVAGVASVHVELRADNSAAYALYRALHFVETFRVPGYYRGQETAVRMVRALRAPMPETPRWEPPAIDAR